MATQSAREFITLGSASDVLEATLARSAVCILRGEPATALELIEDVGQAARDYDVNLQPKVQLTRAEAMFALGRRPEALAAIKQGITSARAQEMPFDEARLLAFRSVLTRSQGDVGSVLAADADASRAAEIFTSMGVESPV